MPEKCCGTCRWWDEHTTQRAPKYRIGDCTFKIVTPDAYLEGSDSEWNPARPGDGVTCACYEPKEGAEG